MTKISNQYIPQLTFTRFVAAIIIVFFHYAQNLEPFSLNLNYVGKWNTMVSYFFILSGFIMIVVNANKNKIEYKTYYWNRFIRIYPLFILALGLLLLYFILTSKYVEFDELILSILLLQAWVPSKALILNYPAWSISVEVFFYLLFPLLFNYIYNRYRLIYIILGAVLFFIVTQVTIHELFHSSFFEGKKTASHYFILFSPVFHLNEFLLGNVLGLFLISKKIQHKRNNYFMLIFALVLFYNIVIWNVEGYIFHNGLLAFILLPLLYFMTMDNGPIARIFSYKAGVYLGDISYAIYILQFPVFLWMQSILKAVSITDKYAVFYIALITLILSSAFSYSIIEKYIKQFRK